ncbi:hypothetical protein [Lentibacillus juripiscarius]|uniref:Uncharacterized protein n=1 Tax=Lentibacillus juripiscarius TaxID=257446 RepID=A0ABW5V9U0_9BACI
MSNQFEDYVQNVISAWPIVQKEGAMLTIEKYGYPQEATESLLIWYNNGPWKRTTVFRDAYTHNWPSPHPDFLANTIDYKLPEEAYSKIARYDGSGYAFRTRGELTVNCDKEENNILSFNIIHDIATGKRSVDEAKLFYTNTWDNYYLHNIPSPYMEKLLFTPQGYTADPDVPTTQVVPGYLKGKNF